MNLYNLYFYSGVLVIIALVVASVIIGIKSTEKASYLIISIFGLYIIFQINHSKYAGVLFAIFVLTALSFVGIHFTRSIIGNIQGKKNVQMSKMNIQDL